MIDERKIEIIAKNFSYDYLNKHKKILEETIRSAYIEGFKEGVQKASSTIKEIAQQTGVSVNTLWQYAAPSYKRRIKGENYKELVPLDVYSIGRADND